MVCPHRRQAGLLRKPHGMFLEICYFVLLTCPKDTRPHRHFPFSDILDALEYDLPHARQNLGAPLTGSPPSISGSGDQDDTHRAHMFKIVTTKRTLLLCAPSEEDELRWLGAVRALITRRSGSGQLPGDKAKELAKAQGAEHTSSGLKGKMRRLSTSGPDSAQEKHS